MTYDNSSEPPEYWNALIPETGAAVFLGLSRRTMQAFRVSGKGPVFVRISSRCIRYRRHDLQAWAEASLKTSTSEV